MSRPSRAKPDDTDEKVRPRMSPITIVSLVGLAASLMYHSPLRSVLETLLPFLPGNR